MTELAAGSIPLVIALLVLLVLNLWGSWLMSGARAWVAGESVWSKSQKDATASLASFARTGNRRDLDAYRARIDVPLGDRLAREALLREPPDVAAAREGFLRGGIAVEDLDPLIWIFRYMRWHPEVADAVDAWTEGDELIGRIDGIGARIDAIVRAGATDPASRASLDESVAQLRELDAQLGQLELRFSTSIGRAARELFLGLAIANIVAVLLLLALGLAMSLRMLRRRREAEARLEFAHESLQVAWDHSQEVAADLELALDGGNVALWSFDPVSGTILQQRRWDGLLGRTAMPSRFDDWLKLTHPDDGAYRLRELDEHLAARYHELEFRMFHARGHWVWVRCRGRVTERDPQGRALHYAGAVMDISDHVAAREIEKREHAFLHAMMEGVDVGVMVSDMDRVVYVNTAFCHLLGYDRPDELAAMPLKRLMPSQEYASDTGHRERAASGLVIPLRVVRLRTRSGSLIKVVSNLSSVDWNDRPYFISAVSPLSEHTVLETQLRSLGARFERAMLAELEGQQAAIARELHDSLGSMLAGLSLLLGNARSLAAEGPVAALVERAQREVKTAAEMTRAMSRGIMPVGTQPGALIQAVEQFTSDLALKGVDCELRATGDFGSITAETGNHVFRIMQEATTNAIKHGRATRLEITLMEMHGNFALVVSDNGTGFDVAHIESRDAGLGMKSMRARAKAIGASLRIHRGAAGGTSVSLDWTLERPDQSDGTHDGPASEASPLS
jgi:PAS domain S-box-containing protein